MRSSDPPRLEVRSTGPGVTISRETSKPFEVRCRSSRCGLCGGMQPEVVRPHINLGESRCRRSHGYDHSAPIRETWTRSALNRAFDGQSCRSPTTSPAGTPSYFRRAHRIAARSLHQIGSAANDYSNEFSPGARVASLPSPVSLVSLTAAQSGPRSMRPNAPGEVENVNTRLRTEVWDVRNEALDSPPHREDRQDAGHSSRKTNHKEGNVPPLSAIDALRRR